MARISYWVPALVLFPAITACSDPVPPASQGAAFISFASPDPPSAALCNVRHQAIAPILTAGNVATSGTTKGTIAIDGENGNVVNCTVSPGGGGYNVGASIHSENGTHFADIAISELVIAEGQSDVSGMVSVLDDITQNAYSSTSATPCKFSVAGESLGVGPGKIWAKVTCPGLADRGNAGGDQCKGTGYFIFENCAQ
jgi:hypothetical protein